MGISLEEFRVLPSYDQQRHVRVHEYILGVHRKDGQDDPIGNGPAVVDFCENMINVPLNGSASLVRNMDFSQAYRNCLGCGNLYDETDRVVGNIPPLSPEFDVFDVFDVRPVFCGNGCIDMLVSRLCDSYSEQSD